MHYTLGVDPGKSGGLALLDATGYCVLATKMPERDGDLAIWLASARRTALEAGGTIRAFLENVWVSPQMGVRSAFTFGEQVGRIKMALRGTGISYDLVVPVKWQNALDCRSGGFKNVTKGRAIELFPMVNVTHALADALLIAEYGRRLTAGAHAGLEVMDGETQGRQGGQKQAPIQRDAQAQTGPRLVAKGRQQGHAPSARPEGRQAAQPQKAPGAAVTPRHRAGARSRA